MIRLGAKVTDAITGYTGIAWSRTEYLAGEPEVGVIARPDENRHVPPVYFAEDRLIASSVTELARLREGYER